MNWYKTGQDHCLMHCSTTYALTVPGPVIAESRRGSLTKCQERCSSGNLHRKSGDFHPYASSTTKSFHQPDRKSGVPACKQIRDRQQGKKSFGKVSNFTQKPAKGSKQRNDNYCVNCLTRLRDCVCVWQDRKFKTRPARARL